MKRFLVAAVAACAMVFAATAAAALQPGVYDPAHTNCPTATYSHGVLHLAKNCPTATGVAAGADITGLTGQTFQSASFTLANASQCQGGSPRLNIYTTGGVFFAACDRVTPTINGNGTVTYTFTAANLDPQVAGTTPGTITSDGVSILIDVQGTADVSKIFVNGVRQVPVVQHEDNRKVSKCKHGGWKALHYKNQGQCVSHMRHELKHHHHGNHDGDDDK